MKRMIVIGLSVLSLWVWLGQTTVAQDKTPAGHTDQTFVHMVANGGVAEVKFGQLAAERAASPDVQQFGQRMVTDHTKANQELATIAQAKHISIAPELDPQHRTLAAQLATLEGAVFDQAYLQGQVADHEQAITLFTTQSKEGQDADLRALASKTLPTLQAHLQMVRALVAAQPGAQAQQHPAAGQHKP
jgi:putative membrane protein